MTLDIVDEVMAIDKAEVLRAGEIAHNRALMSARDAVHIAIMERHETGLEIAVCHRTVKSKIDTIPISEASGFLISRWRNSNFGEKSFMATDLKQMLSNIERGFCRSFTDADPVTECEGARLNHLSG